MLFKVMCRHGWNGRAIASAQVVTPVTARVCSLTLKTVFPPLQACQSKEARAVGVPHWIPSPRTTYEFAHKRTVIADGFSYVEANSLASLFFAAIFKLTSKQHEADKGSCNFGHKLADVMYRRYKAFWKYIGLDETGHFWSSLRQAIP
ncbi:hypothetical protein [Paenibacillus radicis (ex Xue et al. 2023)]|uniref:Uncharacterized protein n=1 Tax=Paenibacillus radicis (ex Xue et al. 2023) TaxID=2972489 RepID=A0ABT1YH43_9BACL|nr:hypothetical protein [Paenibacillus radicis (ex Xue et al. 2023)]MCR8632508.1 hypothetical protein [Paenibacillus radicis (ex Xue et al. 2023)]